MHPNSLLERMNPPKPDRAKATGYQAAVRGLIDRRWMKSTLHRDQVRFTDLTLAHDPVKEFVGKLLRRAAKMGIPLDCESASYDVAFIVHGRRRRELEPLEWEVIGHIGTEISRQYRLGVRWGGPLLPSVWMGIGFYPSRPPSLSTAKPLND